MTEYRKCKLCGETKEKLYMKYAPRHYDDMYCEECLELEEL